MSYGRHRPAAFGTAVRAISALVILATLGACDRGTDGGDGGNGRNGGEALAATTRGVGQGTSYTPRALDGFGQIRGVVQLDGPPPADSVVQPNADQLVCGTGYTRRGIDARGGMAAGVVVFIDGIRSGKPLPFDRRFEVVSDHCVLLPEVQTALAGGTLNVRNLDALEHRTRIMRADGGELLATIRETDEGQVVPNEQVLSRPGILELGCDVHAWTRSWIAVFDHPYYGMTLPAGTFVMDSVPPGRYLVRAWHPRLGAVADSVTVTTGGVAEITLRPRAR